MVLLDYNCVSSAAGSPSPSSTPSGSSGSGSSPASPSSPVAESVLSIQPRVAPPINIGEPDECHACLGRQRCLVFASFGPAAHGYHACAMLLPSPAYACSPLYSHACSASVCAAAADHPQSLFRKALQLFLVYDHDYGPD